MLKLLSLNKLPIIKYILKRENKDLVRKIKLS